MKRRSTTVMGLVGLVVMVVLGAFSAGAAQASTFLWTGALPGLLLVLADGPQVFSLTPGGATFACKHARFHGKVEKERQLTQRLTGLYTGCEALGFPITFTPVEYELSADETLAIVNKTITLAIPAAGCEIKLEPSASNQKLKRIRYLVDPKSENTRLLAHVEVEKLHSIIAGGAGLCGAEGLHTEGSYFGLLLAFVHNPGAYRWVP